MPAAVASNRRARGLTSFYNYLDFSTSVQALVQVGNAVTKWRRVFHACLFPGPPCRGLKQRP